MEEVAPAAGVKVPAPALKVPPVPEVRVQTPPDCSPVIRPNKLMEEEELSQTEVEPSVPASAAGEILTVATEASFGQGEVPGRPQAVRGPRPR